MNEQDYNNYQYNMYQNNNPQQYNGFADPMVDEAGAPLKNQFGILLAFAIIEILLCCLNPVTMVLGIIALVFAALANSAYNKRHAKDYISKSKVSTILLIVGGGLAVLTILFYAVFIGLNASLYEEMNDLIIEYEDDYGDDYEDYDEEDDYYNDDYEGEVIEEYLTDGDIPLPDGFENFTLNGTAYTVPMTYYELYDMGYVLDAEYEGYILDDWTYEYVTIYEQNDPDGVSAGLVRISNDTDRSLSIEDCTVDYICLDNNRVYMSDYTYPELDIEFADGLDIGSSYEEIEAYFGTPTYRYIDGAYERYRWYFSGDGFYQEFEVNFINGEISTIGFDNCIDY